MEFSMGLKCFRVTGNRSFYARRQSDSQPELVKCGGGPVEVWLDATEHANFAKFWGEAALVRVDALERKNEAVLTLQDVTEGESEPEIEGDDESEAPVPKRRGRPPLVR